MLLLIAFASVGCTKDQSAGSLGPKENGQNAGDIANVIDNIPISLEEGVFNKVYGWLDSHTIIYSTNVVQGSNVYAYNLDKGTNRLITMSKSMIVSIDISDSGEYMFIRSSSGPSTSLITITKKDGSVVFTHTMNAFDLTMDWNPYNEQQIFISTFSEDWQARTFFLSIADKKITEADFSDPFSKWYAMDQLVFLDWIGENTALTADLIQLDKNSGKEKTLLTDIYHLDTFKNVLMTMAGDPQNNDMAIYHFYQKNMKEIGSFAAPQVSGFSDRLIPYYDYESGLNTFIYLAPAVNKEKAAREEEFQLIKYDLKSNKQVKILEGLKNEPLSCSRDGNFCLYGYNFEKLIDLNKKKIIKLTS
ncbi:YqgU-like beta propeller domain-containing protein [Bacillus benzoevorans]|uniref:YqgU-like 6-bladed beta-propeller domain-containing protein n=1 Tax=Bacillus benzoevorans TaxID=1456 RepID=A0A7X0LW33_9BACI|nr:hypothetical protein [Bacillus benzoevorans]